MYRSAVCWIVSTLVWVSTSVGQTRYDVFIHVGPTDSLDASYFVPPTTLHPPAGYPALLFVHGFGLSKDTKISSCIYNAQHGYLTLAYSVRGQGNSSGVSTIMSTQERKDLAAVITYLRQLPNVDTANIGVDGSSQGGLHGLWCSVDRLPVRGIVTDEIVPRWASDMLANGCIRRTLTDLLQTSTVHYDSTTRDPLWTFVRTDQYDSLENRFPQGRDVDTAALNASSIPMMTFLKWQDYYFSPADGIESFQRQVAPKKLYLGTDGHWSDSIPAEETFESSQISEWFGYFLQHDSTAVLDEPMYAYAYSSLPMDSLGFFTWTRIGVASWPPSGISPVQLYLDRDSVLNPVPPAAVADSFVLQNKYLKPTYTFDTAYIEGFKGSRFDAILPKQTLVFRSFILPSDMFWIGTPRMKLFVQSSDSTFPIHAQVYEEDSAGVKYFVNRINFMARHWQPGTSGWVEVDGIPHAHKFSGGSRIRIEITNMDKTNRLVLGEYPFVLPLFANASVTILAGSSYPSYIELPLSGPITSVASRRVTPPSSFALEQNYPNPFNSSTVIRYQLPIAGYVSLKLFDVLGREVVTLVDEVKQPGEYTIRWDASLMPSGIYFYRLQAGKFVETKKLVLLR